MHQTDKARGTMRGQKPTWPADNSCTWVQDGLTSPEYDLCVVSLTCSNSTVSRRHLESSLCLAPNWAPWPPVSSGTIHISLLGSGLIESCFPGRQSLSWQIARRSCASSHSFFAAPDRFLRHRRESVKYGMQMRCKWSFTGP